MRIRRKADGRYYVYRRSWLRWRIAPNNEKPLRPPSPYGLVSHEAVFRTLDEAVAFVERYVERVKADAERKRNAGIVWSNKDESPSLFRPLPFGWSAKGGSQFPPIPKDTGSAVRPPTMGPSNQGEGIERPSSRTRMPRFPLRRERGDSRK